MPLCNRLLDCKCDVVESECPSKLVVTGAVPTAGRSNELLALIELLPPNAPVANAGMFATEWNVEDRAPSKLVDARSEVDVTGVVVGDADIAGNFAVNFIAPNFVASSFVASSFVASSFEAPKFLAPNEGYATGAFNPKSSAWTLETPAIENAALLARAHNNTNK